MNRHTISALGRRGQWRSLRLAVIPFVFLFASCYPKYTSYVSLDKDFKVQVPFEWYVMTDKQDTDFTNTTFIGPFDREFFLGAPTLSIRWHRKMSIHKLPGNSSEAYSDIHDYAEQLVFNVYGDETLLLLEGHKDPVKLSDLDHEITVDFKKVKVAGLEALHFIALSPIDAPENYRYGISVNKKDKRRVIMRKHAFVLLPLDKGFYVFVYPATQSGYKKYEKEYFNMINSFVLLKEGPGGKAVGTK